MQLKDYLLLARQIELRHDLQTASINNIQKTHEEQTKDIVTLVGWLLGELLKKTIAAKRTPPPF